MWDTILDLLFCPQDSIIYGTRYGILRPENWAIISLMIHPLVGWVSLRAKQAKQLKAAVYYCHKKVTTK